jgi:hypothetical protein
MNTNKNRMKSLRTIMVNNQQYKWLISDYNCDDNGGSKFKIFKDKKVVHYDIIHDEEITPKDVEQIIKVNKL